MSNLESVPRDPEGGAVRFAYSHASVVMDLIRGCAALIVLLEHSRNLLFVDYPQVQKHRAFAAALYLVAAAGHQAVVIFFVLSGYLISGSVYRSRKSGQWDGRLYMTHRLVRLWIVLVPGLLLCALVDHAGLSLHRAPLLYSGLVNNHMVSDVRQHLGPQIFAGNLVFLQTIRVPVFGSDGALWSLANEFWYYVLFPLALIALARRSATPIRLVCGMGFLAVAWFVGPAILLAFPLWLLGALLAALPTPRLRAAVRWLAVVLYTPLFFVLARPALLGPHLAPLCDRYGDYLLGVATFFLLWIMLSARARAPEQAIGVRATRSLARFSFTLYVVHTPILILLTSLVEGDTRWQPDARHLAVASGLLAVVLLSAYAIAWVTEFRTDRVRAWVERGLGLARAPRPSLHEVSAIAPKPVQ
jgi:peptidoglycan/LPS O-acetylase OafA/YrhL